MELLTKSHKKKFQIRFQTLDDGVSQSSIIIIFIILTYDYILFRFQRWTMRFLKAARWSSTPLRRSGVL